MYREGTNPTLKSFGVSGSIIKVYVLCPCAIVETYRIRPYLLCVFDPG